MRNVIHRRLTLDSKKPNNYFQLKEEQTNFDDLMQILDHEAKCQSTRSSLYDNSRNRSHIAEIINNSELSNFTFHNKLHEKVQNSNQREKKLQTLRSIMNGVNS